ncbi:MAG: Rieske (2Fe-2S) protein [Pannonibacter indicus]
MMTGGLFLCREEEIAEAEAKGFGPLGSYRRKIIVLRHQGALRAWLDSCPHYSTGTPMAWKTDAYLNGEGTHLACHSHGALFDMDTGECVIGPCLGQQLTPVSIAVTPAGEIFAEDLREEKAE